MHKIIRNFKLLFEKPIYICILSNQKKLTEQFPTSQFFVQNELPAEIIQRDTISIKTLLPFRRIQNGSNYTFIN